MSARVAASEQGRLQGANGSISGIANLIGPGLFALTFAYAIGAGFIPVRKPGKLPYSKLSESYALEYGTNSLEIHEDALGHGEKVVVVDDLLAFLGDAPLVIHNAIFDIGFLNAELERLGRPLVGRERMIDTLSIARRKHAGASNRLDDLCARYAIDASLRAKHGALLDAELLAEVYVELIGARQAQLVLSQMPVITRPFGEPITVRERPVPLLPRVSAAERAAHRRFVATLGANAIWRDYLSLD